MDQFYTSSITSSIQLYQLRSLHDMERGANLVYFHGFLWLRGHEPVLMYKGFWPRGRARDIVYEGLRSRERERVVLDESAPTTPQKRRMKKKRLTKLLQLMLGGPRAMPSRAVLGRGL